MIDVINPHWPAHARVRAFSTTRSGGVSIDSWESLNLGINCGDSPLSVAENARRVEEKLPSAAKWLNQVHGTTCIQHDGIIGLRPNADAIFTDQSDRVCAILSADCLPVLLSDVHGRQVAAAHAGWKGLSAGVLTSTVESLESSPRDLMAWLGPCIGKSSYEVGDDVRQAFINLDPMSEAAFHRQGKSWLADLALLARQQLEKSGVRQVFGGEFCTWSIPDRFFSYRRDGITGRMATLIWLDQS